MELAFPDGIARSKPPKVPINVESGSETESRAHLKCEEPLFEKFNLKSLSDEIMEIDKNSNNKIQDNLKSEDLDKIKPPDYFSLREIKNLIIDKFPHNIIKEFNEKIFLDKNLSEVES